MKTIFIGMAAYNEIDILNTINSCLENAKYPERINIGVVSHTNNMEKIIINLKNVKWIDIQYNAMLGVGLSRMNALSMYDNEDYYLQVDAHMLFDKNWDETVIDSFENIKLKYDKPIISTYTPWWSKNEDGTINFYSPENNAVCSPMMYDLEIVNEGFPKQKTYPVDWNIEKYSEHFGISAHFIFTTGDFIYEVPPDPFLMFSGEEPTTALRAWTRGYRIFVIKDAIAWHKNKFHGINHKFDRLKYNGDSELFMHHQRKDKIALKRTKDILTGNMIGNWGSPTLQLLQDYENHAKIDFKEFYNRIEDI